MYIWLKMLDASIAGDVGIVIFFLVSQLFGERYHAKYRKIIWLLIAVRMCIPISVSFFPKPVTVQIPNIIFGESENGQKTEEENDTYATLSTESRQSEEAFAAQNDREPAAGTDTIRQPFTLHDIILIMWCCGSIVVLLYYLLGHFIFYNGIMKRSKECTDKFIITIMTETAKEMGLKNTPQVRVMMDIKISPFTIGFFHNTVILPNMGYQEADLRYIIQHEMVHCANRDVQIKALFAIVSAIHWFNPCVWLMKSIASQDIELACDERVLKGKSKKERSEYSEVLLSCIGTGKVSRSAFSTGYIQGAKFIKKRFRNIFNMHQKGGIVAGCMMIVLLIAAGEIIDFKAGRTVYAKERIVIDCGIELRTDVTGDGIAEQIQIYDDTYTLTTSVMLRTVDGREAQFDYNDELWAVSYLIAGDLSKDGAADIVVMRNSNGMHGEGSVSVLHVTEKAGNLIWQEYPPVFISNPSIDMDQPAVFDDILCIGATVIEEKGCHYLRLIALDMEVFDDDTVQCIDCSLQETGWFIEDIRTITGYYSENKINELLENNDFNTGK